MILAKPNTLSTNDVKLIILHEMRHVLGLVGTTNGRCTRACDDSNPLIQTQYACSGAADEYETIAPGDLFLENNGGMGTACGHFEERSFRAVRSSEIMTGFFEADLFQPISSVTVAALQDLGYEVDFCGADIWPANEDTIKRFEVYRASQQMAMDTMMDFNPPGWTMAADTGDTSEWSWTNASETGAPDTGAPETTTAAPTAAGVSWSHPVSLGITAILATALL